MRFLLLLGLVLPAWGQLSSDWTVINRLGDQSNSELECFIPGNVAVNAGMLEITASHGSSATCTDFNINGTIRNSLNTPWYSGAIQTSSFTFTFGDVQFRAKVTGAGSWPGSLWLLGSNCQASNLKSADNIGTCVWNSDTQSSGELDIAEMKTGSQCCTTVSQNNCTDTVDTSGTCPFSGSTTVTNYTSNFHVYELIWTNTSLTWKVDGTTTNSTTSNVPQHPMFMYISDAIGGAGGTPSVGNFPMTMQVDWVKVCSSACSNGITGAPAVNGVFFDDFVTSVNSSSISGQTALSGKAVVQ